MGGQVTNFKVGNEKFSLNLLPASPVGQPASPWPCHHLSVTPGPGSASEPWHGTAGTPTPPALTQAPRGSRRAAGLLRHAAGPDITSKTARPRPRAPNKAHSPLLSSSPRSAGAGRATAAPARLRSDVSPAPLARPPSAAEPCCWVEEGVEGGRGGWQPLRTTPCNARPRVWCAGGVAAPHWHVGKGAGGSP